MESTPSPIRSILDPVSKPSPPISPPRTAVFRETARHGHTGRYRLPPLLPGPLRTGHSRALEKVRSGDRSRASGAPLPGVWRQSLADGALNFMGYRLAAPGGHAPHRLIRGSEDRVVARPAVSADEPFGWWVACRRSVDGELARSWGCLLRWAVDDRYVLRPERLFPPASTILGWKNCWAIVAPTVATSPNLPRVPVPQGSNPAPSPRRAVVQ